MVSERGIPVDSAGGPTVDPTKNVLDLVEAANRRQDDLRKEIVTRLDNNLDIMRRHFNEMLSLYEKRYAERYEASEKAIQTAFTAQKEAVREAFEAQKGAVYAALNAQERAVQKAETSTDERFRSITSLGSSLGDQMRILMPRSEVMVVSEAITGKVSALESQLTSKLLGLEKQFDTMHAERLGIKGGWGYAVGVIGFVLAVGSIIMLAVQIANNSVP